ncbi:MAG: hypothetical protein IT374_03495 [Polyangiaceae bacterium]|nr:hypothetical protein [Polyangiaceae bacterium]
MTPAFDPQVAPREQAWEQLESLARAPERFVRDAGAPSTSSTRALLATIVLGGAVFGAVIGGYRGGAQVAYAAVKLPAFLLGTLALSVPAFVGLARAFSLRVEPAELVALSLGATARLALVLVGLAPVLWLLSGVCTYHSMTLWSTAAMLVAGLSASSLLFAGLARRGTWGKVAGALMVAVFGLLGAQTSWMLRPFLVRPRTVHVPFMRAVEGDPFGSVSTSLRSATGSFAREPGEWTERTRERSSASEAD